MNYVVDIYNTKGKVVKSMDLNPELFADHIVNTNVIHEYFLYQQSNDRANTAHSKTRAEVAGSGKKLFKQKGTGSARPGSLRSPVRRKGWVAFGPRNERNYQKSMNKKTRNLALRGLLTLKAKDKSLIGLDAFDAKEIKTKVAVEALKNIGLTDKKVLFVLDKKDDAVQKSFRNIAWLKYILVDYLNPFDLMAYDTVLMLQPALEKINVK